MAGFILPSVPTLSKNRVELGSAVTIDTNAASADYTHKIEYYFNTFTGAALSGLIADDVKESCTWSPELELARAIPNTTEGRCSIYCTTYDENGRSIGTKSTSIWLIVPDSVRPTASHSWKDASGAYGKLGVLVQNVSKLDVEVTGTGIYGSSILKARVYLDDRYYKGSVLTSAGDQRLWSNVVDSRERSGYYSETIYVAAYTAPQITLNASRCTEDGTADDFGEHCKVTVTGSTTQVNGRNEAVLSLQYGYNDAKSINLNVGDFTYTEIVEASSVSTLKIKASVSDVLLSASKEMVLSVGYATIDYYKGGKGIAFGTTATKEGFVCAMDAEFKGKISGTFLDSVYPVNSIYISYSHTSPAELFGGTWTRIVDRFLWGTGSGGAIGHTDGEAKHTLTANEMPVHQHSYNNLYNGYPLAEYRTGTGQYYAPLYDIQSGNESSNAYSNTATTKTGGGAPHNIMPPYIQVSIWRRTG